MTGLSFTVDAQDMKRIEAAMSAAGREAPNAIRRAINWVGDRSKTRVVAALTEQTGLKRGVILRAVKPTRANFGALIYRMRAAGGNVALKYFGAKETTAGVTAAPWGVRSLYAGTFIRGGQFPRRVPLNLGGQVFARAGAGRLPIVKQKSGLFIPRELVRGATAAAFESTVVKLLPGRVEHEVGAILSGFVR
jgi:hypothetical protein